MSRKMQFFHQLDEKIAETFLGQIYREVLYRPLVVLSENFDFKTLPTTTLPYLK